MATLQFPSGRSAEEVVPRDAAALVWMANLACLELHPHPVRADDLDHPDELRVDLDPVPGVEWPQIRAVAAIVRATLDDFGLVGWPKTSGSRGMHIYVRIERRWALRRGAPGRARAGTRGRAARAGISRPASGGRKSATACSSTTTRTRRIARLPRPTRCARRPDARVSAPLAWDEIDACEPGDFTLRTMPSRFAAVGDRHAGIDGSAVFARTAPRAVEAAAGRGAGRRAVAAALPEAGRRGAARGAVEAPHARRIRSSKSAARATRPTRWRDSIGGRRATPTPRAHLEPADVLVDAMRGRFRTWTRVRVNLQHVPERREAGAGSARSRRAHGRRLERGQRRRVAAPKTCSSS